MNIFMEPSPNVATGEGGITTIVRNYQKYMQGVTFVDDVSQADIHVVHAGSMTRYNMNVPMFNMLHGLYWTGEYQASPEEYDMNDAVINVMRGAGKNISVPSEWVAQAIRKNFRVNPYIIPHGYDSTVWSYVTEKSVPYVYWNKNRDTDVCDPKWMNLLSDALPEARFISTFGVDSKNVSVIGVQPYDHNRELVEQAGVYLSTTKETFGIGVLEALVSGTPVLGFRYGGNCDLVSHKVTGYLANPLDVADLANGYRWIMDNYNTVRENLKRTNFTYYDWRNVANIVKNIFIDCVNSFVKPANRKVTVVIPSYNKATTLGATIQSVLNQTHEVDEILIVDNNSTDDIRSVVEDYQAQSTKVFYYNELNQGVAYARNGGILRTKSEYILCLDGDDMIEPTFIELTKKALDENPTLGIAYTGITTISKDGVRGSVSTWPTQYNFSLFLAGQNQVPTCALFRRELWERVGGYRQRFAPLGAGAEDAEMFFRMGLIGYRGKKVTNQGLFLYRQGGITSNGYSEADWRNVHNWKTNQTTLPFGACTDLQKKVFESDKPKVSIIIPCTKDHLVQLYNALDSVAYQDYPYWEVIVVLNGVDSSIFLDSDLQRIQKAYPFAQFYFFGKKGAGFARNRGAEVANAPYLLFLDADDWLEPDALAQLLIASSKGDIVTSDYYGWSKLDETAIRKHISDGTLISNIGIAKIRYTVPDYNQALAAEQPVLQPDGTFYIWSLITSLVPKAYWQCVGGFDESMQSWEDWDFWIRLAREKMIFVKTSKPVINYQFNTGNLRELGKSLYQELLLIMNQKRGNMPCCGGRRVVQEKPSPVDSNGLTDEDLILVELIDGNQGDHLISIRGVRYGSHVTGDQFYVKKGHALLYPAMFRPIIAEAQPTVAPIESVVTVLNTESQIVPEVDAPKTVDPKLYTHLSDLINFSFVQKKALRDAGIISVGDYLNKQVSFASLKCFSDVRRAEINHVVDEYLAGTHTQSITPIDPVPGDV